MENEEVVEMFARDRDVWGMRKMDCWRVAEIQFQIKYPKFDSLLAGMVGWALRS